MLVSSVIPLTLAICPVQYAAIRYTKCKCNNMFICSSSYVRYATLQFTANVKGARVKDKKNPPSATSFCGHSSGRGSLPANG